MLLNGSTKKQSIEHKDDVGKDNTKSDWEIQSFVYGECTFEQVGNNTAIIVEVDARKNAKGFYV